MRKIIVLEHITLDGVIQAGGGPEEDTSGGFMYGGWVAPYIDPALGTVLRRQMNMPFDLLLGRKTFEIKCIVIDKEKIVVVNNPVLVNVAGIYAPK